MRKKLYTLALASAFLAANGGALFGQTQFNDSFETIGSAVRLDSTPNWDLISGNSYTGTGAGQVRQPTGADNITVVAADTIHWSGENFTFSIDLDTRGTSQSGSGGIVFGLQDANNYYRASVSPSNGALSVTGRQNGSSIPAMYYQTGLFNNSGTEKDLDVLRITVDYAAASHDFTVTFYAVSGALAGEVLAKTTFENSIFTSGQFGLYSHYNDHMYINDFSVGVTPIPEASNTILLLAGITVLLVLARRRKSA